MKAVGLTTAIFLCVGMLFSQKRVRLPGETSYGVKGFFLPSMPSAKSVGNGEVTFYNRMNMGYGISGYAKYQIKPTLMVQPEILLSSKVSNHFFSSETRSINLSLDQSGSITNEYELLVSYFTVSVPVYFKKVFEITPIRRGHSKYTSTIGLVAGPRLEWNYLAKKSTSYREITTLYGQSSRTVAYSEKSPGQDVVNRLGAGLSLGADWEMSNGMILHIQYYRSLTSSLKKEANIRAFNNQFEIGLGYRLY